MKRSINIIEALFTFSLFLFTSQAAVPLKWTVETSRAVPAQFEAYQGETLALEAALQSYGKPLEAPSNYALYWQTNGMGSTYWSVPCPSSATTTNVLFAKWSPTNDVGAKVYNCFIGQPGTIYHAAFQLRLRPSPGATPNELPLPQKVIDFAKVTVLNPPWSGGGGGGVDTNAVLDLIHKTVDGSARALPPYLHYLEMDDTYPEDAAEWYAQADYSPGSCSAVRDGGFLYRNYDWNFDFMPEFVVRTVAASATGAGTSRRFASLAVCNVGTNLTEADVTSGKWSKWYKALPGHAVDGINSEGVVAAVNVVSTNGVENWHGDPATDGIHCLGAIRWVLDHATNAQHGAEALAERVYVPQGYGNFHYMVADSTSTYIVENGEAHLVTGATGVPPVAVLTNFGLYPTRDTSGEGQERYDALAAGANITSQWWTLTYTPDGYRASDLPGIDTNLLFRAWAATPKESHRGETFRSQPLNFSTSQLSWWQTVHTSVYDISNRVLCICVQENPDWYVFSLPGATGVSPVAVREIVEPMIAAATNGLRRIDDLNVYAKTNVWTFSDGSLLKDKSMYHMRFESGWADPQWLLYYGDDPSSIAGSGPGGIGFRDPNATLISGWVGDPNYVNTDGMVATRVSAYVVTDSLATTNGVAQAIAEHHDDTKIGKRPDGAEEDRIYWDPEGNLFIGAGSSLELGNELRAGLGIRLFGPAEDFMFHDKDGDETDLQAELDKKANVDDIPTISATDPTFSNEVATVARTVTPSPSPNLRVYDEIRQCWWIGKMINGVINWEVE